MEREATEKHTYLKYSESTDIIRYALESFIIENKKYPSVPELIKELNDLVRTDVEDNQFTRSYLYGILKRQKIETNSRKNPLIIKELAESVGVEMQLFDSVVIERTEDVSLENKSTQELLFLMSKIALELSRRDTQH